MAKKMTAVEHSEHFAEVKDYYDNGLWNEKRVRRAVVKGWITEEEAEEIINGTGDGADEADQNEE